MDREVIRRSAEIADMILEDLEKGESIYISRPGSLITTWIVKKQVTDSEVMKAFIRFVELSREISRNKLEEMDKLPVQLEVLE